MTQQRRDEPARRRPHMARSLAGAAVTATLALASLAAPVSASTGPAGSVRGAAATPGVLRMWGDNASGELGDGTSTDSAVPVTVQLPPGATVTSVRIGCFHTVALASNGGALAWGSNAFGQLGNDGTAASPTPVPVKLPAGVTVTAVRAGCEHSLALTSTGQVLAWGDNSFGELGLGSATSSESAPVSVGIPNGALVKAISAGSEHSLALTTTGKVFAWGNNETGQLGDGTTTDRFSPVRVKIPVGVKVTALAATCCDSLALTSTGKVLAWGDNGAGELGNGSSATMSLTPVPVSLPAGTTVRGLFGGDSHVLALTSTGKVLAWGDNGFGQLGIGTIGGQQDLPVRVHLPSGTTVSAITAGNAHSLALTSNGAVFAWGDGLSGQLGNGAFANTGAPVQVQLPPSLTVAGIGAGPDTASSVAIVH